MPHAGFAAQSLLAALGSVQFVTNVIFAHYLLHERVCLISHLCTNLPLQPRSPPKCCYAMLQASDRVMLATGIVMTGCVILVCSGDHQSKMLTVDDMIRLYRRCQPRCFGMGPALVCYEFVIRVLADIRPERCDMRAALCTSTTSSPWAWARRPALACTNAASRRWSELPPILHTCVLCRPAHATLLHARARDSIDPLMRLHAPRFKYLYCTILVVAYDGSKSP